MELSGPSSNVFFTEYREQPILFFWKTYREKKEREIRFTEISNPGWEDAWAKVLVCGCVLSGLGVHKEKTTLGSLSKENSSFLINENSLDFKKTER